MIFKSDNQTFEGFRHFESLRHFDYKTEWLVIADTGDSIDMWVVDRTGVEELHRYYRTVYGTEVVIATFNMEDVS
jgi:hypothetical protein